MNVLMLVACFACAHKKPLGGVQVPEDLIALPGTSWVLVSNLPRADKPGWLSAIDSRHTDRAPVRLFPNGRVAGAASRHCPGPPAVAHFSPHGVDVRDGKLYVINHGDRESIEIFDITAGTSPALTWRDCILVPSDVSANSLTALEDGRLVATGMFDPHDTRVADKLRSASSTGRVVVWDGDNWRDFTAQRFSFANGIAASPHYVFIAEWAARTVWRFTSDGASAGSLQVDFSPDNIRWTPSDTLLVAGQRTAAADFYTCASQHRPCPLGFSVVEIAPDNLAVLRQIDEEGSSALGAASVAIAVGDEIWVGGTEVDAIGRLLR